MTVTACGKAILCGEYAVLDGAPAISIAVNRGVLARIVAGRAASAFVEHAVAGAIAFARRRGASIPAGLADGTETVEVDSSALYGDGVKLGFGSSAAVTVAAVGATLEACGLRLDDRAAVFAIADEAHAAAQGVRGAGVDVATSVWGGVLRFERTATGASIRPVALPRGISLILVFVGRSASTADYVQRVRAWRDREPAQAAVLDAQMLRDATSFADACDRSDKDALLAAARAYAADMTSLGAASRCDIVTPTHALVASLAERHGCVAKPSGAGGGDLAVAFCPDPDADAALSRALSSANIATFSLTAPGPGLAITPLEHGRALPFGTPAAPIVERT